MTPGTLLLYDCYQADYVVLGEALHGLGYELVVNETALAVALRRQGVPFIPFDLFATDAGEKIAARELLSVVTGLCAALHDPAALSAFTVNGRYVLTSEFLDQFIDNAAMQLRVRLATRELLRRRRVMAGIFGVDCYARGAMVVATLREEKVPTLQLMHGDAYNYSYSTAGFRRLISDHMAVFGDNSRYELIRMGFARDDEITVTGSLPWDNSLAAGNVLTRQEARGRLGLPQDRVVALLCTDYQEVNNPLWFCRLEENVRRMRGIARALVDSGQDPVLLFRPHPSETTNPGFAAGFAAYRDWLRGLGLGDVRLDTGDRAQAIVASDFVMVFGYSSMIGEIMLMRRPALVFENDAGGARIHASARRGKLFVAQGGQFADTLRRLCADTAFREEIVWRQDQAVAYHQSPTGPPLGHLTDLIHGLATGATSRPPRQEPGEGNTVVACPAGPPARNQSRILARISRLKTTARRNEPSPADAALLALLVGLVADGGSPETLRRDYGRVLGRLFEKSRVAGGSVLAAATDASHKLIALAFELSGATDAIIQVPSTCRPRGC
jgi:hypothetical protein